MNPLLEKLIGRPQKIEEKFSEVDLVNAIVGACSGDTEKLKKGLGILKKSQLKKVYREMCPEEAKAMGIKGDEEGASHEDSESPAHEKKESPAKEKKEHEKKEKKEVSDSLVGRVIGKK